MIPAETEIARVMGELGCDRLPAIQNLQQREELRRRAQVDRAMMAHSLMIGQLCVDLLTGKAWGGKQ